LAGDDEDDADVDAVLEDDLASYDDSDSDDNANNDMESDEE
jgi:hypothetical protein